MLSVLTVLGMLLAISTAYAADEPQSGKVKSASADSLVVTVGTTDHTFKIDADTKVTLDGKEAKATDLKAGDMVKVTSKAGEGANKIATKIEATRKPA
jgi:hypothetical protein